MNKEKLYKLVSLIEINCDRLNLQFEILREAVDSIIESLESCRYKITEMRELRYELDDILSDLEKEKHENGEKNE